MVLFRPFSNIRGGFVGRPTHLDALSVDLLSDFIQLDQIHSDRICLLKEEKDLSQIKDTQGDAIISLLPKVGLAIRTADCVPILIGHSKGAVAAVHAGWRGTHAKILQKTLLQMREKLALEPTEAFISIGPAICKNCYRVGEEVATLFRHERKGAFLSPASDSKFFLDLKLANFSQAISAGVPKSCIEIREECTLCQSDLFYSYRGALAKGEKTTGRNYAWVVLEP